MTTNATDANPSLQQRLRGLSGEVIKFGVVGLSGVLVNFLVFWVCINELGLASLRSNIAATLVAIATNYVGYRYWCYRDRDAASRKREITLFLVFSFIGMGIETGVLGFTVYVLGLTTHMEQLAGKALGLVLGTVFRFISYRTWVFKAMPELAEAADDEVVAEAELLLATEEPQYVR